MTQEELTSHMAVARRLAEEAGQLTLEYFRRPIVVEDKKMPNNVFDPVTEADKRVEEQLRIGLNQHFPGYAI